MAASYLATSLPLDLHLDLNLALTCFPPHMTGFVGSLVDSLLGATCQVTRFDDSRGLVVKAGGSFRVICGRDLLSNAQGVPPKTKRENGDERQAGPARMVASCKLDLKGIL